MGCHQEFGSGYLAGQFDLSSLRFPTVPHLLGSASEAGDVVFSAAQTRTFLSRPVLVLEKLDGLNVGVFFEPSGALRLVSRCHGVLRPERLGPGLWPMVDWVWSHAQVLRSLLKSRWVMYGEWLGGPSRLAYPRLRSEMVSFALFDRSRRRFVRPASARQRLSAAGLSTPPVRFAGQVASVEELLAHSRLSSFGGPAEGCVVERGDGRQAKVVRAEWMALPPATRATTQRVSAVPIRYEGRRLKLFPPDREEDCALEARVLTALRRPAVRVEPLRLELLHVRGRRWPQRPTAALAWLLGQQLGKLHRVKVEGLPPLPGLPSAHLARVAPGTLVGFLRAQERHLRLVKPVPCHGDLKPDNLVVDRGGVWLIDFERVVLADPAWDLACAMDRLDLDATARGALMRGWAQTFGDDPQVAQRVQLFRIAWREVLPLAVAALEAETGRVPSAFARKWIRAG